MKISEMTDLVYKYAQANEQLRKDHERLEAEVKSRGSADPLLREQLDRITRHMDETKARMEAMETASGRPAKAIGATPVSHTLAGEYKSAYQNYLRKGMDSGLENIQTKALAVSTNSGADGGYLVTPEMADIIVQTVTEMSPMRELASVTTISTDSLDVIQDNALPEAEWAGETAAREDTTTAQIAKNNIPTFELHASPKATQKLIDDSAIDIEAWLAGRIGEAFAAAEATAFIGGNGTSAPKGILTYTAGTSFGQIEQVDSGTDGAVTADGLIQLFYSLKDVYAKNATFLMNRSVIQSVRLLKNATTGEYIWQPGLAVGAPDTLLGVPVKAAADMPAATTDSLSVAVGDFKRGYQIVDRQGIRILRDPFTDKPYVKFYTTKRVGGEVVNSEAIKLLKLSDGS